MEVKDMALLIETEDTLESMDRVFEQLAGHGHACGDFGKLDNVFEVIQNNSHETFSCETEDKMEKFFKVLLDREKTPEERAVILMNGAVCK